MPNLREIEKPTVQGKNGMKITTHRIVTESSYQNRNKGITKAVPMTYDEAVKYAKEFNGYTGKKHLVSFRYSFGWRSGGVFESDNVKVNYMIDDYDDEGNEDLFDKVYAIDIKVFDY